MRRSVSWQCTSITAALALEPAGDDRNVSNPGAMPAHSSITCDTDLSRHRSTWAAVHGAVVTPSRLPADTSVSTP